MARYELLDNVIHKDLRVITHFGAEFGDDVGMVPAFPTEFAELQREYPIFFRKDKDSGEFMAVALLGLEPKENLYLQGNRWNASYLPGAIAKGPFVIGFQPRPGEMGVREEPVLHVDLEHPRIAREGGEAVFLPQGGQSPYLQHIIKVLRGINDGNAMARLMFAELQRHELLQPVGLDVRVDEEYGVNLNGLWGIDRPRLAALDAGSLHALHRSGLLEGIYLVLASEQNLRRLVAEKQRRRRAAAEAAA